MLKSDKPGRAIKLRQYAKWMRRISDPAADMFFRMASAISQNPDKEFEMKPPPLVVSYEAWTRRKPCRDGRRSGNWVASLSFPWSSL